jgi:hypothetical protein
MSKGFGAWRAKRPIAFFSAVNKVDEAKKGDARVFALHREQEFQVSGTLSPVHVERVAGSRIYCTPYPDHDSDF